MKYIYTLIGIALAAFLGYAFYSNAQSIADNGFSYYHIDYRNASATAATVIRGGSGMLGAITVNSVGSSTIRVFEGSSTATTSSQDIIAIVASSTSQNPTGTKTYNVAVRKGIVFDIPAGFAGDITVSYR